MSGPHNCHADFSVSPRSAPTFGPVLPPTPELSSKRLLWIDWGFTFVYDARDRREASIAICAGDDGVLTTRKRRTVGHDDLCGWKLTCKLYAYRPYRCPRHSLQLCQAKDKACNAGEICQAKGYDQLCLTPLTNLLLWMTTNCCPRPVDAHRVAEHVRGDGRKNRAFASAEQSSLRTGTKGHVGGEPAEESGV